MMRRIMPLIGLLALAAVPAEAAAPSSVHKEGAFTVRKVGKVCKMEIALPPAKGHKGRAILTLFKNDTYHSELITERKSVGAAKEPVKIAFDSAKAVSYALLKDAGADDNWRWRYLARGKGLLDEVKRRSDMRLSFSNGKRDYVFQVSLSGSGKAVQALEKCK